MALVREKLGLSDPAELERIDRRIRERDVRLQAIDKRVEVEFAADRKLHLRRAGDRQ